MNVPWVDPCAFSPSWQLARRKVRQNQACTEHNPSDWQLCPLVTVWLSPKLLYFTEIMIFYGHRFEDNCCILRVVVLQGDTAASFGEEMGGKKSCSVFFPLSLSHSPFPASPSSIYFFYFFIYLHFLQPRRAPIPSHCPGVVSVGGGRCSATDIPSLSPATSHGDNAILQWSMKDQTFRSREIGEGGKASEGILCTWLLFIAAWCLAVLMARYVGPQGVVKNHHGPGKGINARGSSGDCFQNRPGADVQTAQHLPRFTSLTLAPVDGFSLWILTPKGVKTSKNVDNPEKKNGI